MSHYDYASFTSPLELSWAWLQSRADYSCNFPFLKTMHTQHWSHGPKITPNSGSVQTFTCKTLLHWWEMKSWHRRNTSSKRSPESEAVQTNSKISLFVKEPETSASQSDSPQLECECSELNFTGMDWVRRGTAQWKEVLTICLVNTQLWEKMVLISWKGLLFLLFSLPPLLTLIKEAKYVVKLPLKCDTPF